MVSPNCSCRRFILSAMRRVDLRSCSCRGSSKTGSCNEECIIYILYLSADMKNFYRMWLGSGYFSQIPEYTQYRIAWTFTDIYMYIYWYDMTCMSINILICDMTEKLLSATNVKISYRLSYIKWLEIVKVGVGLLFSNTLPLTFSNAVATLPVVASSRVASHWASMLIPIESDKTTSIYNVSTRVLSKK